MEQEEEKELKIPVLTVLITKLKFKILKEKKISRNLREIKARKRA